jgi:hypothetical protein
MFRHATREVWMCVILVAREREFVRLRALRFGETLSLTRERESGARGKRRVSSEVR